MTELSIASPELDMEAWKKKKIAWLYSVDKETFLITSKVSRYWNKKALSRRAARIAANKNKLIVDLPEDFYLFYLKAGTKFDIDLTKETDASETIIITQKVEDIEDEEAGNL